MNRPAVGPASGVARFQNIDALRALAALLVVWQHSSERFVMLETVAVHGVGLSNIADRVDFGRIGVVCFFLVSGFVIPWSLRRTSSAPIRTFVTRRFFRLYPVYWASMLLAIAAGMILSISYPPANVLANATMLQTFLGQPHMLGLYWTLQIELVFYALCVVLFAWRVLESPTGLLVSCAVLLGAFVALQLAIRVGLVPANINDELQYLPYPLAIMFSGSLVRQLYDAPRDSGLWLYTLLACGSCLLLPVALITVHFFGVDLSDDPIRFGMGHILAYVLFILGLFAFRRAPRWLLWVGAISYSLYLFHPIVMDLLYLFISRFPATAHAHLGVYIAIVAVLSIALASVMYLLIEKPFIAMGHRRVGRKDALTADVP